MQQAFNRFDQDLTHANKSFESMQIRLGELKETFGNEIVRVVLNKSTVKSEQIEESLACLGKKLADVKKTYEDLKGKYEQFERPIEVFLTETLNIHASKSIFSEMLSLAQNRDLVKLIDMPASTKWKLIYSGKRDGFGADQFHLRCDGKENTLTLVKSEIGDIFGGYTEATWDRVSNWKNDPNAFIFGFVNRKNAAKKIPIKTYSICCVSNYGPWFSGGINEIKIATDSNSNNNSLVFIYDKQENFKVSDIEVFQKY